MYTLPKLRKFYAKYAKFYAKYAKIYANYATIYAKYAKIYAKYAKFTQLPRGWDHAEGRDHSKIFEPLPLLKMIPKNGIFIIP